MSQDFNWDTAPDDQIVTPTISSIAAYLGPAGDVVIRQQGYVGKDDDVIVVPVATWRC